VFSDLVRSENEKIGGIIKTAKITFQ